MRDFEVGVDDDGVVRVAGELDLATADRFSQSALDALDGQRALVIDVSNLAFIDSTGIRAILTVAGSTSKGVVLRDPSDSVRRVLAITAIEGRAGIRIEGSPPPGV